MSAREWLSWAASIHYTNLNARTSLVIAAQRWVMACDRVDDSNRMMSDTGGDDPNVNALQMQLLSEMQQCEREFFDLKDSLGY